MPVGRAHKNRPRRTIKRAERGRGERQRERERERERAINRRRRLALPKRVLLGTRAVVRAFSAFSRAGDCWPAIQCPFNSSWARATKERAGSSQRPGDDDPLTGHSLSQIVLRPAQQLLTNCHKRARCIILLSLYIYLFSFTLFRFFVPDVFFLRIRARAARSYLTLVGDIRYGTASLCSRPFLAAE